MNNRSWRWPLSGTLISLIGLNAAILTGQTVDEGITCRSPLFKPIYGVAQPIESKLVTEYEEKWHCEHTGFNLGHAGFRHRMLPLADGEVSVIWSSGSWFICRLGDSSTTTTAPRGIYESRLRRDTWGQPRTILLRPSEGRALLHDAQAKKDGRIAVLWSEVDESLGSIDVSSPGQIKNTQSFFSYLTDGVVLDRRAVFDDEVRYTNVDFMRFEHGGLRQPLFRFGNNEQVLFFWLDRRHCFWPSVCPDGLRQRLLPEGDGPLGKVHSPAKSGRYSTEFDASASENAIHVVWAARGLQYRQYSGRWRNTERLISSRRSALRYVYGLGISSHSTKTHVLVIGDTSDNESFFLHGWKTKDSWTLTRMHAPVLGDLPWGLRVFAGSKGQLHALMQPPGTFVDDHAYYPLIYVRFEGGTMTEPRVISPSTWPHQIDIVEDSLGRVHATWVEHHGSKNELRHAILETQ